MEDCERRCRDGHLVVQRLSTLGALGAGTAYLVWRLLATMGSGPWWLAGPFLVIELWGFALLGGLLFRAWPRTQCCDDDQDPGMAQAAPPSVDVVVTAGAATTEQIERSLVGLAGLGLSVTVVEGRDRPEVRSLCGDFAATYRTDGGASGAESLLLAMQGDAEGSCCGSTEARSRSRA